MNPAQARAVTATFTYVSELLDGVLRIARRELTHFDRQRMDVSREEADRLEDVVRAIRRRMLEALSALGIPDLEPDGSARWGARTSLLYADVALSELTGQHLRAYGAMGEAETRAVVDVATDLRRLIVEAEVILGGEAHAPPGAGPLAQPAAALPSSAPENGGSA